MPYSALLASGEGPRLAFVQTANAELVAENLVAFANTEGGTIVVGLGADGTPAAARTESGAIDQMLQYADEFV